MRGHGELKSIVLKGLLLMFLASRVQAGNYAECLLDKLPGLQNDAAAHAVAQVCWEKYPGGYQMIEQGSGRGYFSKYSSGAECTIDKAKHTSSKRAGIMVGAACRYLYDKSISTQSNNKNSIPFPPQKIIESNQLVLSPEMPDSSQPSSSNPSDAHYDAIYSVHPDADDIATSAAFQDWVSKAEKREQVLKDGTTNEVIALFSDYKKYQCAIITKKGC